MLDRVLRLLAKILVAIHVLQKMVVVRVDGGICSQMHFYLIGRYFCEKGFKVKYDLYWYKKYGKDLNGNDVRNFDLLKAFPYLKFDIVKDWELFMYRHLGYNNKKYTLASPPTYLGSYYEDNYNMYTDSFPKYFHGDISVLDIENRKQYQIIQAKQNAVAIHVRRGDLANYNGAYGNPVGKKYFAKAIDYVNRLCNDAFFYFFSDEPDWVKKTLIGQLPLKGNCQIVDINGSEKGYMDLMLISACKHQICSKGSLGKYGGLLRNEKNGMIIVFDDEVERKNWSGKHPKIVFIS